MKKQKNYAVIGLGCFGKALAIQLFKEKCNVLGIDKNEETINEIKDYLTYSAVCDSTDEKALKALGINNFDAVCICIGELEASVLTSLACIQSGATYIIGKARTVNHKILLDKIGLNEVIIPEFEMGKKLAIKLLNPVASEVFEIDDNLCLIEASVPKPWHNKTMIELDVRKKFKVNVILIKRNEQLISNINGETKVNENDVMVVVGEKNDIDKLVSKIKKIGG